MRRIDMALVCVPFFGGWAAPGAAENVPEMTLEQLGRIAAALDPDAVRRGHGWRMRIGGRITLLTADEAAGRLRAMVPIRSASQLGADDLRRMMQANFDSALDGRYAIARGIVWSVFVRPLRGLDKDQLIAGLAQTVMLARTYGTLYSGGGMQFGGGDSPGLQRGLLEELMKRGEAL